MLTGPTCCWSVFSCAASPAAGAAALAAADSSSMRLSRARSFFNLVGHTCSWSGFASHYMRFVWLQYGVVRDVPHTAATTERVSRDTYVSKLSRCSSSSDALAIAAGSFAGALAGALPPAAEAMRAACSVKRGSDNTPRRTAWHAACTQTRVPCALKHSRLLRQPRCRMREGVPQGDTCVRTRLALCHPRHRTHASNGACVNCCTIYTNISISASACAMNVQAVDDCMTR